MILFVTFWFVLCSDILTLEMLFIFILSLKLKYNQCLLIINLFRNEVKRYLRWAMQISKRNCTHFKGRQQFYFEIALLSWVEQILFITWSPNTLGNNFLAVIYGGKQGLLWVHNDGTQKLLSNHGFTTFSMKSTFVLSSSLFLWFSDFEIFKKLYLVVLHTLKYLHKTDWSGFKFQPVLWGFRV